MTDQATTNRRDMLLVASSMLAATAICEMPAAAQSQMPATPKTETTISSSSIMPPDDAHVSASRGRRVS